jgi:Aspartyl protease
MPFSRCLSSLVLAVSVLPAIGAEPRCPGNVTSLPLRLIQSSLIVVSVQINSSGPYDFVVDTGAQISTVETSLAAELHLKAEGTAGSAGIATFSRNEFVHLGRLQAGDRSVTDSLAIIGDIADLRVVDPRIRGILGDNFLEHFDLLIDNRRKVLCLDEGDSLASSIKSAHIGLATPIGGRDDLPFTRPLIIAVRSSGSESPPMLLRLDSGSNAPVLYNAAAALNSGQRREHPDPVLTRVVYGGKQGFQILPAMVLRISPHVVAQVSFAVPMNSLGRDPAIREDGVLPTMVFEKVFISAKGQYATVDSW